MQSTYANGDLIREILDDVGLVFHTLHVESILKRMDTDTTAADAIQDLTDSNIVRNIEGEFWSFNR